MNKEQLAELPRVGPVTRTGALLRRYWFPVAASSELGVGEATQVRLLGEDLVLFRTTEGELGILEEHCPHRRTSLLHGCIDDEGIRCPYHGWKFDAQGTCLEMPAERDKSELLASASARAFSAQELGGLIFAYIGPDPAPLLPRYDLFVKEHALRDVGRALLPCNWLQIMENSVDPTHVEWLHGHSLASQREKTGQRSPRHYLKHHLKIGFDVFPYGIIKRRVVEGGSEEDDDWKVGHPLIFPCMLRVGSAGQHRFQIRVPVDDTHTLHWWYSCYMPPDDRSVPVQDTIPVYDVPWQDAEGLFIVDFVDGQDIMTWVTQGPIADRSREHLVASDKGIVMLRRLLLEQVERVEAGLDPLGTVRDPLENQVIRFAQENEKYGHGADFLAESIALSHVRHSPLRDQIIELTRARDPRSGPVTPETR